jgi:CRISPR/Cas system-associated endoribonuclease Cas2
MPRLPPDEMQRVYVALGRAMWHLQYVEEALNALLTVKHEIGGPGRATEEEARGKLTKRHRVTMGPSVKLARDSRLLAEEELDRLERLKSERDWVAHKVQRSVGDEILSPWGRLELVRRLNRITSESQSALSALIEEMRSFVGSAGHAVVIPERLNALLEADRASGA